MADAQSSFAEHNQRQRNYFESTLKRTMLPTASRYVRRHVDELCRFARIEPGDRVLEVGCGMGRYTLELAKRGLNVAGLDLSPVLLDRLHTFDGGRYSVPLYCADVVEHPTELDGQFDVVAGFFTLHHVHDLRRCFSAMYTLLRPGGRIVFLEPNPLNPLYYLQIALSPRMSFSGEKGLGDMRPKLIFAALESNGFVYPAVHRFGFFPPAVVNQRSGAFVETYLERVPLLNPLLPFQLFSAQRV